MPWRRIKDELPPKSYKKIYIFWEKDYGYEFGTRREIDREGEFETMSQDIESLSMYTHWHELPKPPEEEK